MVEAMAVTVMVVCIGLVALTVWVALPLWSSGRAAARKAREAGRAVYPVEVFVSAAELVAEVYKLPGFGSKSRRCAKCREVLHDTTLVTREVLEWLLDQAVDGAVDWSDRIPRKMAIREAWKVHAAGSWVDCSVQWLRRQCRGCGDIRRVLPDDAKVPPELLEYLEEGAHVR